MFDDIYYSFSSLITPQLYISDLWIAESDATIRELGITHVVSVLNFGPPQLAEWIPANRRLYIDSADNDSVDILQHFDVTTAFITAAINDDTKNKVLVHCLAGVSRSPTVVCAYLVATTDMTASETLAHVKSLRHVVSPVLGFVAQLEKYGTRFVKPKIQAKPDSKLLEDDGRVDVHMES